MKQVDENGKRIPYYVVPYIGTWIETKARIMKARKREVVPYIGTWIETTCEPPFRVASNVVPYIGTWIETRIV